MDISNKTLAMFLVAAIVVSIAGTTISLNRLGEMSPTGPTGFATTDTGNVTVTIGASVSIVINATGANSLDFTCSPSSLTSYIINSENTSDTHTACSVYPNNVTIDVYNDGNVDANVSINVSNTGEAHDSGTFLLSEFDNSWIAYKIFDGPNVGCAGTSPSTASYTNFTNNDDLFLACDNLSYPFGDFAFAVEMLLPQSADTVVDDFVEITFWAKERT